MTGQPLPTPITERPVLGISACLLGEPVRFNGGHKHAPVCTRVLGDLFDWQAVCPETAIGLGVPRAPVRLLASDRGVRMVGTRNAQADMTDQLQVFASQYVRTRLTGLSGFVFMQKSPSCGLFRVPLYRPDGEVIGHTAGLFAAAVQAANPQLPCEEAGRLHDPLIREHFVTRVLAWHDWQRLLAGSAGPADVLAFHARYKYQLMAHSPQGLKHLGRLLANLKDGLFDEILVQYGEGFTRVMASRPSRGGHVNALMHIRGYLKRAGLLPREQQRLDGVLDEYRQGLIPRMVPLNLLRQHFDRYPQEYVGQQVYLNPASNHPILVHGA